MFKSKAGDKADSLIDNFVQSYRSEEYCRIKDQILRKVTKSMEMLKVKPFVTSEEPQFEVSSADYPFAEFTRTSDQSVGIKVRDPFSSSAPLLMPKTNIKLAHSFVHTGQNGILMAANSWIHAIIRYLTVDTSLRELEPFQSDFTKIQHQSIKTH